MRLSHLGFVCAGVVLCLIVGIWPVRVLLQQHDTTAEMSRLLSESCSSLQRQIDNQSERLLELQATVDRLFGSDGSGSPVDEDTFETPKIPYRITFQQWSGLAPGDEACDVVVEFNRSSLPDGTMIHVVVTDPLTGLVFGSKSQDIAEIVPRKLPRIPGELERLMGGQPGAKRIPDELAQMRVTIYRDCVRMDSDWVSLGFELQ